jgi:aspartyl-tRNA(Asn)/glutamyl-tRNA(Gln) amidotransferase subunit A
MEGIDLLMTPTTSVPAFPFDDRPTHIGGKPIHPRFGFRPYTFPINMLGYPAASVPCGFLNGMPLGLHIVGRMGEDTTVLRASAAFEEALPWQDTHPAIA